MSTQDVPGANTKNCDQLEVGCWAEHEDGSLLFVKGVEGNQVVYELYDISHSPIVYYQDSMLIDSFKNQFSYPPVGISKIRWTWHDKTPFPWNKVMKIVSCPVPINANVVNTLSAAARVAESLQLRAKELQEHAINDKTDTVRMKGSAVVEKIKEAFKCFKR